MPAKATRRDDDRQLGVLDAAAALPCMTLQPPREVIVLEQRPRAITVQRLEDFTTDKDAAIAVVDSQATLYSRYHLERARSGVIHVETQAEVAAQDSRLLETARDIHSAFGVWAHIGVQEPEYSACRHPRSRIELRAAIALRRDDNSANGTRSAHGIVFAATVTNDDLIYALHQAQMSQQRRYIVCFI